MTEETIITRIEPRKKISFLEWREILAYRDLIYYLALRDVQLRYKQTSLGIVWVILQPLVPAMIFAVIFGYFAKLPSGGQPYLLMVLCGLLAWNLFSSSISRAGGSVVASSALMSKVYFPRVIVPIAALGSVLVDTLVACLVLAVVLWLYGIDLHLQMLAAPFFLLLALGAGLGMSLMLASLNVYFRDFSHLIPFGIQIWNYVSPVVYSADLVPEKYRFIYAFNPMVGIIEGVRWSILGDSKLTPLMVTISVVWSLVLILAGFATFRKVERGFADYI